MAPNPTNRPDENPYFDPVTTHRASDLAPSRSAPQYPVHALESAQPTTPTREEPPTVSRPPPAPAAGYGASRQMSSIGLRRLRERPSRAGMSPVAEDWQKEHDQAQRHGRGDSARAPDGRRRSSSEPQRPNWLAGFSQANSNANNLPAVPEASEDKANQRRFGSFLPGRRGSWLPNLGGNRQHQQQQQQQQQQTAAPQAEYDSRVVDLLDVVDPEVSTLTSITNLQNSLFIPQLGRFVNRRPTYDISWADREVPGRNPDSREAKRKEPQPRQDVGRPGSVERAYSITSNLEESHYAVLPHGASLEGWSKEDVDRLNDHVRHMLHSRRSKFKRSMKGFGRYVRRPLGFLVTLYATLITLFGLAWVLFLIGWIYVGDKQVYIINIIDYILVALFAIVGDGLAPFRAVDTYHMIYIAHYHRLSWKLRKKLMLPKLPDHNDLPTDAVLPDLEAARETASLPSVDPGEISVLTPKQQEKLTYHQTKYAKSHTFYRPHETETHFAFPLKLLVTITSLLDLHSCLQIALGSCTWGIPYDKRPSALTTTILCCSIAVNSTAGLLIWIGDRRTRKKDVIERMSRQEMTEEAMHKVQKQKQKVQKEAEKAARRSSSEEGNREGEESGWRGSLSLPRLSIDKWNSGTKKGESSPSPVKETKKEEGGSSASA